MCSTYHLRNAGNSGKAMMNTDSVASRNGAASPPGLGHVAKVELGETAEVKVRCLSRLRELIAGDKPLLCPMDDKFLVKFLRARKYSEEAAFKNIQKYFRVKQTSGDFFKNLSPYTVPLSAVLPDHKLMMVSKRKDPEGRRVAVIKLGRMRRHSKTVCSEIGQSSSTYFGAPLFPGSWNTGVCSVTDLMRSALVMAEWALLDEETQVRGVVCVFDLKNLRIMHMAHFTPGFVKKTAHIMQDCYPVRIKAIYVINNPPAYEIVFAAVKPFLKSKLLQRIYFMGGDLQKLHGVLPADVIPVEYGGTHEEFDYYRLEKDVKSSHSYFEHISRFGYRTDSLK
ncbi:alpha-tocopherol transfer protein-like [Dermacentor andersoni]|uniref:alpha-tocopherol transfer protein-like n=1 Tax=Dermacentor andersoni TaxID=34620 RepID=UPI003B3AE74D